MSDYPCTCPATPALEGEVYFEIDSKRFQIGSTSSNTIPCGGIGHGVCDSVSSSCTCAVRLNLWTNKEVPAIDGRACTSSTFQKHCQKWTNY